MSKKYLTIYNLNREKDWVLKNAFDIIETQEINTVWEMEFSIPKNDQDMEHCQPYWYIRYGDDGQMYRFTEQVTTNANESTVTYHCEHVIATLSDDIMFQGPYIIGNIGTYTNQVLNFILDKQTVRNWTLGTCQPRRQFEYSWENENLLAALFSVPNCFATPYMWTYDTTSYPWKVNLVEINPDADPDFYLMARKNILQSTETSSNLEICTRLYGLGEGEGVNQLTIKSVNNGLPYIQSSAEKIAAYGIVSRIFTDRRYQYPETLKARMEALLHELETPAMKREFDIVDLYDMSPDDMYKAEVGRICLLKDDNTKVYITKTVKNWTVPGDMKITIATKATDISTSIADLADRQRIEQVYSQGASQVYAFNFSGNATDQYPLNGYIYFPDDLKYLNEVKLKIKLDPFRSYSKASSGSNGGINQNTGENGAINQNTGENGAINQNTGEGGKINTETGEGGAQTGETSIASGGGGISLDSSDITVDVDYSSESTDWARTPYTNTKWLSVKVKNNGEHDHDVTVDSGSTEMTGIPETIPSGGYWHRHYFGYDGSGSGRTNTKGDHGHDAWVEPDDEDGVYFTVSPYSLRHKHKGKGSGTIKVNNSEAGQSGFSHKHNFKIKAHTHNINVKGHSHNINVKGHSHSIKVGPHSHDIEAGIFTSGNPTQADLLIDGVKKATITQAETELDITQYLLKDGKVPRGQWINLTIKPTNPAPNNLAFISAFGNVFAFIQSYTGGNF